MLNTSVNDFVTIDVETANPALDSICQIGIVHFRDGMVYSEWESLINPNDYFDPFNVSIHGICQEAVEGSPLFSDVAAEVRRMLAGKIVASHTGFDRSAIRQVSDRYGIAPIEAQWVDVARVVRRTWSHLSKSGYGLANVCKEQGIEFRHHNALEDARATGCILLKAIESSGISLADWLSAVNRPIAQAVDANYLNSLEVNQSGSLCGEVLVFTGALSIPRREASMIAANLGCAVDAGVNQSTTILVVGDQDGWKLAGYEKSSKHRKAESLISKGQSIRILTESDFRNLR